MTAPAWMTLALAVCAAAAAETSGGGAPGELRSIRTWSGAEATRVVVELSRETKWKYGRLSNPDRLFIDFQETRTRLGPKPFYAAEVGDSRAKRVRVAMRDPHTARLVLDLAGEVEFELSHLTNPERLVIELRTRGAKPAGPAPADTAAPATAAGTASREEAGKAAQAGAEEKRETPKKAVAAKPAAAPEPRGLEPRATASGPSGVERDKVAQTETGKAKEARRAAKQAAAPEAPGAESKMAAATAAAAYKDKDAEAAAEKAGRNEEAAAANRPAATRAAEETKPAKEKAAETAAASTKGKEAVKSGEAAPQPARPMRSGERSMTRALGLRIGRVVLDPGHGGHDEGTRGPTGLVEKELVLDVALRLGALIEERLGGEVVYTRKTDEYVGLEERTAIANEQRADLFLSIHANSSPVKRVSGAEVFFLNFTNSKEALDLAARENAGHNKSIFELRELLQKIALSEKLDESREFARFVQRELSREWKQINPASRDRGVKMAPFVVLIGASMPSVLAEIGFVTNARDERLMKRPEYRQRLAEALYRGVEGYAGSLGQTQALRAATPALEAQSAR